MYIVEADATVAVRWRVLWTFCEGFGYAVNAGSRGGCRSVQ